LVNFPPRSLWFHLRNLSATSKLFENYDILHGISPEIAIALTFLKKHSKTPLITTLHGSHRAALEAFIQSPIKNWTVSDFGFHVLELPLHELITRRCFAKSKKVVACSFATMNELRAFDEFDLSKISVIYNGVDFSEIQQEAATTNEKNQQELSIMYAGRLFWMKGITFVLEAYEKLEKQFKNVRLKIFGRGPLENEVKKFATEKGLRSSVYFGGFLPHKELIQEIKKSDVVVFPSLYESQPMFALETMACKKPLIAFNVAYARELVKNGHNGLLASPYDVEDLSNKIAIVLRDKSLRLRLGENAFEYAKKNHDWDVQAEKYYDIYYEVMNERN
jgi:glycosyltransferase involved in cell wall biosynthesis